jgi:glycosyltransferase involved in cell wall biosynthesis
VYKNYAPIVGGIENHLVMLAEGEAARGLETTVLVASDSTLTTDEMSGGVRVVRAARVANVASTPFSLAMALEGMQQAPDIVNLHMPYPPGDIVARAVPGRPALVLSYHSDVVRQRRLLRVYRPLLEHTLARADRIIASSAAYVASSPFLRAHQEKCRVVPYGVDGQRWGTVDPAAIARIRAQVRGPIVLCVGVLRYYKGLHVLLDAMVQLDASLIVVGEGPEGAALRAQAERLGVSDRVHWAGRVPDGELPAYYQAADVFVLASHLRAEAFGIVLLEAMAAGLPLVTTAIGTGTSEVNIHGQTGFVVPPNDPHALARVLRVLLADERLRGFLGANARRRALTEYTPARMVERTMAVYNEALAARATGRQGV